MIAPILLVCILLALAATAYFPDNDRRELPTVQPDSRSLQARDRFRDYLFDRARRAGRSGVLITLRPRSSNRIIARERGLSSRDPT